MPGQEPLDPQLASSGPRHKLLRRARLALPIVPALKPVPDDVAEPARVREMVAREEEAAAVEEAQRARGVPRLGDHCELGARQRRSDSGYRRLTSVPGGGETSNPGRVTLGIGVTFGVTLLVGVSCAKPASAHSRAASSAVQTANCRTLECINSSSREWAGSMWSWSRRACRSLMYRL